MRSRIFLARHERRDEGQFTCGHLHHDRGAGRLVTLGEQATQACGRRQSVEPPGAPCGRLGGAAFNENATMLEAALTAGNGLVQWNGLWDMADDGQAVTGAGCDQRAPGRQRKAVIAFEERDTAGLVGGSARGDRSGGEVRIFIIEARVADEARTRHRARHGCARPAQLVLVAGEQRVARFRAAHHVAHRGDAVCDL